jgi:hypothetical protein
MAIWAAGMDAMLPDRPWLLAVWLIPAFRRSSRTMSQLKPSSPTFSGRLCSEFISRTA